MSLQAILSDCLDEIERLYFPKIYPHPRYSKLAANQRGRAEMVAAGQRFDTRSYSSLANACLSGLYSLFIQEMNRLKIKNLNHYFEGESKLSLLHCVMFGRKKLLMVGIPLKDHHHIKIAKYLLDHDLFVDIQSKWGYSSLHECVINQPDLEFAKFLLQNGANPNLKTIFGETPLHSTVMQSSIEALKLLCEYRGDPRIKEQFSDVTPISLARYHIEASTILGNTVRKLESDEAKLEHEDTSYCIVCSVSSKKKRLYQCQRCQGPERYCGKKCQKVYWKKHKKLCKSNRNKPERQDSKQELVFLVHSAQGEVIPLAEQLTGSQEMVSEMMGQVGIETHRKKYQKKRNKRFKKQMNKVNKKRGLENKSKVNIKVVVKVQISKHSSAKDRMLIYNKTRRYTVYVDKCENKMAFKRLYDLIDKQGFGGVNIPNNFGKKAYFYAWVDDSGKLHILIAKVLALQPW